MKSAAALAVHWIDLLYIFSFILNVLRHTRRRATIILSSTKNQHRPMLGCRCCAKFSGTLLLSLRAVFSYSDLSYLNCYLDFMRYAELWRGATSIISFFLLIWNCLISLPSTPIGRYAIKSSTRLLFPRVTIIRISKLLIRPSVIISYFLFPLDVILFAS